MIDLPMFPGGPRTRALGPPAAAALLLVAICVLRFALPDTSGVMLFATVPVALLGIMLGVRAGLGAALLASAVYLVWAATEGDPGTLDWFNHPLTFFTLGGISGYFAHGALGDFDWRKAVTCSEVRRAVGRGEVRLDYQPIVQNGERPLAVEALARWDHPKRGPIAPADFIPASESDERTIWDLTMHTLQEAVRQIGELESEDVMVAVNISPVSLQRPGLAAAIGIILEQSDF